MKKLADYQYWVGVLLFPSFSHARDPPNEFLKNLGPVGHFEVVRWVRFEPRYIQSSTKHFVKIWPQITFIWPQLSELTHYVAKSTQTKSRHTVTFHKCQLFAHKNWVKPTEKNVLLTKTRSMILFTYTFVKSFTSSELILNDLN